MKTKKKLRVVVADDHPIVRQGICHELNEHDDIEIVGEAVTGHQALAMTAMHKPDVLLLDISMPDMNGIEVLRRLKRNIPCPTRTKPLIMSAYCEREYVYHAFAAGAQGYLLKDEHPRVIAQGIRRLMNGQTVLSKAIQQVIVVMHQKHTDILSNRERDVLKLVAHGKDDYEIADYLEITIHTVRNHIANIYSKIPTIRNRAEAVAWAWQNNVV